MTFRVLYSRIDSLYNKPGLDNLGEVKPIAPPRNNSNTASLNCMAQILYNI